MVLIAGNSAEQGGEDMGTVDAVWKGLADGELKDVAEDLEHVARDCTESAHSLDEIQLKWPAPPSSPAKARQAPAARSGSSIGSQVVQLRDRVTSPPTTRNHILRRTVDTKGSLSAPPESPAVQPNSSSPRAILSPLAISSGIRGNGKSPASTGTQFRSTLLGSSTSHTSHPGGSPSSSPVGRCIHRALPGPLSPWSHTMQTPRQMFQGCTRSGSPTQLPAYNFDQSINKSARQVNGEGSPVNSGHLADVVPCGLAAVATTLCSSGSSPRSRRGSFGAPSRLTQQPMLVTQKSAPSLAAVQPQQVSKWPFPP